MNGFGKLLLRATVGGYFVGHGLQKLRAPDDTAGFFESVGLKPGKENALLAGATETVGGALLTLGLLTPFGVAGLSGVMTNAIRHVHGKNGAWITDGGVEHPVVVLAALAAIADEGPGPLSLDAKWGMELKGAVVAALALAAGAAGATYVAERGEELFAKLDADTALTRATEHVRAES